MKEKLARWFAPEEDHLPRLETLAVISFVLLLVSTPLFSFSEGLGQYIREYMGLFWHFSMFFFISKLPTPEWGRICGRFWIVLDVLSGLLYLNNFYGITGDLSLGIATQALTLCTTVRLAAHCFEGLWLISSAMTTRDRVIRVCGVLAGVLIAAYSVVSPFAPGWMLSLNVPFMLIWFIRIVQKKY